MIYGYMNDWMKVFRNGVLVIMLDNNWYNLK